MFCESIVHFDGCTVTAFWRGRQDFVTIDDGIGSLEDSLVEASTSTCIICIFPQYRNLPF